MNAEQANIALTSRKDIRISRDLADRALYAAQQHGYYNIDDKIAIAFDDDGFHIDIQDPQERQYQDVTDRLTS